MHLLLRSRQQLFTPHTPAHTLFSLLLVCHKGPAYQSATVAVCSFPPGNLTKGEKDTISSV